MATPTPTNKILRLMTPLEAAAFLSVSPRTLMRLTSRGSLAFVRVGGQRRYEFETLLAYVTTQRQGG